MAKKEKKLKNKGKGFFAEFKEFINKGNAFMLAVGVVIGGAFSAIVTAFVNILMSLATWGVPGGLAGLVTPLHPLTDAQKGLGAGSHLDIGLDQKFAATELQEKAGALALKLYGEGYSDVQFVDAKNINWGALINAVISFIIVAIVLFIIVKVVTTAAAKKAALQAKMQEEYYNKHPEERPAPVEEGAPQPTSEELLAEIRDLLKAKK